MADQPPLDIAADLAKRAAPTFWNSDSKANILMGLYISFAVVFISISVLSHSKCDQSFHVGRWESIPLIHREVFHTESYDFSDTINFNNRGWALEGTELWELYAIGLTMIFSLLLLAEPQEKPGVRLIIMSAVATLLACIFALLCLGWHHRKLYQAALLFIVLVLAFIDGKMYRATEDRAYKLYQLFVDLPMLISLSLLMFYVRFPVDPAFKKFFSGALAFQFIIGCLLVLLIREHERIINENRWVAVALVGLPFRPFVQIVRIGKTVRAAKVKAKQQDGEKKD